MVGLRDPHLPFQTVFLFLFDVKYPLWVHPYRV